MIRFPQDELQLADIPVEHVVLEGDDVLDHSPPATSGRTLQTYTFGSPFHRCLTELSLHDGYLLGVRSARPRRGRCEYQFDLCFASPAPVRIRQTSWPWLTTTLLFALLAGGAAARIPPFIGDDPVRQLLVALAALLACAIALIETCRRTTESLQLHSATGNATLVSVTGGIGATRGASECFIQLANQIRAARRAYRQPRQAYLCEEMREHHRLFESGVLSTSEYESSKVRILAAHEADTG